MMTAKQALKAARAKWGSEAFVRYDRRELWKGEPLPRNTEERTAYRREYLRLKESEPKFTPMADWPADTQLGVYREALTKYNAEKAAWRERSELCRGLSYHFRYSVGTAHDIFSTTKGHGDSWEEALTLAGAL
jgi:hypothetical protein